MKRILKNLSVLCIALWFFGESSGIAHACDFEFSRKSESTEGNLAGVEDVISIKITKNHRRCHYDFNEAKIKGEGLEILAATPWKQENRGVFKRMLKVVYQNVESAELKMVRNCKEGLMIERYKIDVTND